MYKHSYSFSDAVSHFLKYVLVSTANEQGM